MQYLSIERSVKAPGLLEKFLLLFFYAASITYLEFIYRLWNFKNIGSDFLFAFLFAVSAGTVLFLISALIPSRISRIISVILISAVVLIYEVQLVYYAIFHTPLSFYSVSGAEDALQFKDIIETALMKNIIGILLLLLPLAALIILLIFNKLLFIQFKPKGLFVVVVLCVASYLLSILCVRLTGDGAVSQYTLYYKTASPELSVTKLGLLTTMRLDLQRLIFGFNPGDCAVVIAEDDSSDKVHSKKKKGKIVLASPKSPAKPKEAPVTYNTMKIDFNGLIKNEKNTTLLNMDKYFSSVEPSKKNKYTGMFKGYNLILITAESFSPYFIDKNLTPTLYKMANEGFVFKNFYNPVWGVSTSDGEYVACTGLIPKSGIWSFARSGKDYLPFVMGNQFRKLGYPTRAYHDHTYTYYKRNISHPNMGYDYKGVGNGLVIKKTWPESDVEMIEATAKDYIGPKPFHTYYMSVSGHMNYSFTGNSMSYKNRKLVAKLPYSQPSKAYIAANLEFEAAMKLLMQKLEAAGIADKTVIAISGDHYPYGLPRNCIDELAGHKVEDNFELYKSTMIIYKKGMTPVVVDRPCSALDRIPTLSNLFGLEYDSRLMMGQDIMSDSSPLVIFSNRSWITDKARFNSITNTFTYTNGNKKDPEYEKRINNTVANKFYFSARILDMDYYRRLFAKAVK